MMPVWFGAMNMPMPTEFKKMSVAKPRRRSSPAACINATKVSATSTRPPVANGRAP